MPIWSPAMIFGSATSGYVVEESIWLDGSSDYLNKTFSGTGTNRKKFTFSCWFKLGSVSTTQTLLSCDDTGSDNEFMFWVQSDATIRIANYVGGTNAFNLVTTPLYRDPTAWYNLILEADSTPSTPSSASIKLWINGVQVTAFSTETYPSQNFDFALGNSFDHEVGRYALSDNNLWNGYIAEMVFIDGTDYTYTDFGEFDDNGVWVPIDPSGLTFGTNGFYLDFSLSPARQTGMTASNTGTSFVDFNAANTVDNDPTSKAFRLAHGVTGQQLDLDMGSGNTLNLKQVGMYMDNGGGNGQGATWSVFYSDNGSDYTDTSEDITYTDNGESSSTEVRKALSSDHGAHRYWRLTVSATSVPSEPPSSGAIYGVNLYDAGLGKDASGQNNHFTENSFTVANQVTDTCTDDADNDIGNYATLNPLATNGNGTLSTGNLNFTVGTTSNSVAGSTIGVSSGKFYGEATYNSGSAHGFGFGIANSTSSTLRTGSGTYLGEDSGSHGINASNGNLTSGGSVTVSSYAGGALSNGTTYMWCLDMDNGKWWAGNADTNTWFTNSGVGNPATGANAGVTGLTGIIHICASAYNGDGLDMNFGQTTFTNASNIPTGFKPLNTANLAAPTVTKPDDFYNTVLYTGNGGDKSVTGVGFQPDFVWIKCRSVATNWNVVDVVRGADSMLRMASSTNAAQSGANQEFESFDADGFTVTHHGGVVEELNRSSATYVAYCMKAGGSGSSNSDGDITSTVSVASHNGFSIVKYDPGSGGSAGDTVGHGMGQAPNVIISKPLEAVGDTNYQYGTDDIGWTKSLFLNTTGAPATAANYWNNTAPTSTVFSLGSDRDNNTAYIAYCFAKTPGLIGLGSYVGNGAADGAMVVVDDGGSGFRPAWVMIKRLEAGYAWHIQDAVRSPHNPTALGLNANDTGTDSATTGFDFIANGFKLRAGSDGGYNGSGASYIYLAFAEHPFGGDGVAQGKAR